MPPNSSAARAVQNENLFREVNNNIEELSVRLSSDPVIVCECADPSCVQPLGSVRAELYERVRGNPRWFFVAPGHQSPDLERVIERRPEFLIVEKIGEAGELAAAEFKR